MAGAETYSSWQVTSFVLILSRRGRGATFCSMVEAMTPSSIVVRYHEEQHLVLTSTESLLYGHQRWKLTALLRCSDASTILGVAACMAFKLPSAVVSSNTVAWQQHWAVHFTMLASLYTSQAKFLLHYPTQQCQTSDLLLWCLPHVESVLPTRIVHAVSKLRKIPSLCNLVIFHDT